jgi:hypothetical protein
MSALPLLWAVENIDMKDVYALYASRSGGRERSRWVRVGVAFDNRDVMWS